MMNRLYFSVPSVTPVKQPSLTLQYSGDPSQPDKSLPLKIARNPSGAHRAEAQDDAPVREAVALEHLLLYERARLPGKTRDQQYKPLLDDSMADVRDLVHKGQIILAIKLYREKTGVGLREAKETVEAMR